MNARAQAVRWPMPFRTLHLSLGCVVSFGLVLGAACGHGKRTSQRAATPSAGGSIARPMLEWSVRMGSEGGFTGGGSGYVIRFDGSVESWSQITPDEATTTEPAGRASPETLRALFLAMTSSPLRTLKLREHGNMTAFLEWRQAGDLRRYSWPEGGITKLPTALQRAYEAALAAVGSARH